MELVVDFRVDEQKQELYKLLKKCNRRYKIKLTEERDSVSTSQRGYYRAVVLPILADHLGYDNVNELHCDLKITFLGYDRTIKATGETVRAIRSTESLDTKEYGQYLDKIIRWAAAEMSCYIPDPSKSIVQSV